MQDGRLEGERKELGELDTCEAPELSVFFGAEKPREKVVGRETEENVGHVSRRAGEKRLRSGAHSLEKGLAF